VPAELAGEAAVIATMEQIDLVREMIRRYPAALEIALTAADVEWILATGKVASLLGAEGGHSIACSLGVLRALHAIGVRYLTLTHNRNVPWADSATDEPAAGGLTAFGREVAGIDHVGIGGDYDGTDQLPDGLRDVSCYPALIAELLDRGWSEADCGQLASGNILRVMHEAQAAAAVISARRPPSQARIEDLDGTEA